MRELKLAASAAPAPREALCSGPGDARAPDAKRNPDRRGACSRRPRRPARVIASTGKAARVGPSAPADAAMPISSTGRGRRKGKIIAGFSETANLKGIDIAGTAGEAVRASAPGRVVYAGSGLRGYGKLIIIKHNATYLSAYAHNREILVKEGQQVTRGQKIAEMGNTDADQVKLHFEIRRHGKPMDPAKYLPPA